MAHAQVVLTVDDLNTQLGQYSFSYMNDGSEWSTNNVQGPAGGPQVWDFREGPAAKVAIIEVLDKALSGVGDSYPNADYTERQRFAGGGDETWWFLELENGAVHNWGLLAPAMFPQHPTNVFSPRITDFPASMAYGNAWSQTTYFNTTVEGVSGRIRYQADFNIDAWGTILTPQGQAEGLRINRLVTLAFQVNVPIFGWQTVRTEYVRTYMWVGDNKGMMASLISTRSTSVPGADFATALSFTRLYETNHPGANPGVSCADPAALACGAPVAGNARPDLFPAGVYYQLDVPQESSLTLTLGFEHDVSDLDLVLLDAACGVELASSGGTSDQESVSLPALAAGSYRVHVLNYGGAANSFTLAAVCGEPIHDLTPPVIAHTPLTDSEQVAGQYLVQATLSDDVGVVGATLGWAVGAGSFTELAMAPQGGGLWSAGIPVQPAGTTIRYRISASDGPHTTQSTTWSFHAVDAAWPPAGLVASDDAYEQVSLSWYPPVAPVEPGQFFEGFEAGIPANWTVHDLDNGDDWSQYTGDHYEGAACAGIYYDVPNNDWLITPPIPLTAASQLEFFAKAGSASWVPELLTVYISTGGDQVGDFTTQLLDLQISNTASWDAFGASLAAYAGQSVRLGFWCHSNDRFRLMLDNVRVTGTAAAVARLAGPQAVPSITDLPWKIGVEIDKAEASRLFAERLAAQAAERAFQHYLVYRDGVEIGSSATTSYLDTTPLAGQVHGYSVRALWDGGLSQPSNTDDGLALARPTQGGPDAAGYRWTSSLDPSGQIAFAWNDIQSDPAAQAVTPLSDDGVVEQIPLGFEFPYYGQPQTTVNVCMNGQLTFGVADGSYSNVALPSSGAPANLVAALWNDLDPGDGVGAIHTLSDPAHGRFIVQYSGVPDYPGPTGAPNSFQIILKANGQIEIHYLDLQGAVSSATAGIQDASRTIGLTAHSDQNGCRLQGGMALLFSPVLDCPTPAGLEVSASGGSPLLTWEAVPGAGAYRVDVAENGFGPFTPLAQTTTNEYTDSGAPTGGRRFYRVVALCD